MAELTTRPYRDDDAPAVSALLNTIEEHTGGHAGYGADEVRSLTDAFIADPATDTRLVFDAGGALVAAATVDTPPAGGFRVDLRGGVRPDRTGQGLGRELLSWQVRRAAEIRAAAGGTGWEVEVDANLDDEPARRLFTRLGFAAVRYFAAMEAPTKESAPVPVPAGLVSRGYDPALDRSLHQAHTEAFADHWGYQARPFDQWAAFTVRSAGFLPELSRVAFDGDQIAGYLLSYREPQPERFYIGHVGTRRAWRRRGLAGALLAEVLAAAAATGHDTASLGVDADSPTGAVGVYERVGFRVRYRAVAYRRPVD